MEEFNEEINLTREEVDKLEESIESLRKWGRVHFEFTGGMLNFNCDEFAKLKEKKDKDIKKIKDRENK